jgi:Ser-tRNA(Ala) deacylase AlaX
MLLAATMVAAPAAVAGIVDTPECRRDLAMADQLIERRQEAWEKLLDHLQRQKPINIGTWTREELYEREDTRKRSTPEGKSPVPKRGETP